LIVTGDLTRVGAAWEFDMARLFLEKEVPYRGKYIGLRNPYSLQQAIPGNHDHYPGIASLVGGPTRALGRMFSNTFAPVTVQLGSGHELTFCGLILTQMLVPGGIDVGVPKALLFRR
jgi:hypothetical protein